MIPSLSCEESGVQMSIVKAVRPYGGCLRGFSFSGIFLHKFATFEN